MSRIGGALVCLGSLAAAGVFAWGIYLRNYWAIAIPVILIALVILGLGFWIGLAMAMGEPDISLPPPKEQGTHPSPGRLKSQ